MDSGAAGVLAVGAGAATGAWLRWTLGRLLNGFVPELPLGTLAANLIGGYLIGAAVAFFERNYAVPPEVRLFIITGFLGGLTTFSTFSAETTTLLLRGQYGWTTAIILAHLLGSITMTVLGIATVRALQT